MVPEFLTFMYVVQCYGSFVAPLIQVLQILPAITHFQAHVLAADDRSWTESSKQSLFSMDDDKMFEMFMALIEKSVEDRPRCKEMFNRMSGPFHDKQMWPKSMTAHEKIGEGLGF